MSRRTCYPNTCLLAHAFGTSYGLKMPRLCSPATSKVSHGTSGSGVPKSICPADYSFGARRGVFAPLLGDGIFTQEGEAWKHSRELLRKQFIRIQYQSMDQFFEHVDNLLERLPADGVIDLQPLFFDFTLDITTALLLGHSVRSLKPDIIDEAGNKAFAENFSITRRG